MAPMNDLLAMARVRGACIDGSARRVREDAHLSVREVARVVGAEPSTVSRWERATRLPRGSAGERYARLVLALEGLS